MEPWGWCTGSNKDTQEYEAEEQNCPTMQFSCIIKPLNKPAEHTSFK